MMNTTIGIIGFGNMGSAIAEQLKRDYQILCFDKDSTKTEDLPRIRVAKGIEDLVKRTEVIILAVKPQDFDPVLGSMKGLAKDKLIISIAAGITTDYIEKMLGPVRVIRAMPNIAAKIGEGVICLSKGRFASEEDFDLAENLFDYLGESKRIEEEKMDAATAVSGSGPGFCFALSQSQRIDTGNIEEFSKFVRETFIPSLRQAAESVGFSREEAEFLSVNTGNSCIGLLVKTKLPAEELKAQVTSRGGTTEAGLEVLRNGGSLTEAVLAAKKRAQELSRRS
jgi:pyrroline-5-carboxylate reductase